MTALLPRDKKKSRYLFDWSANWCLERGGSLDAITGQAATFTRAGNKSAYDANGVLRQVPHSLPAFEWSIDPVSGLSVPGVVMEETRTNLALYSQDMSGAAWSRSGLQAPITNSVAGPDGMVTADTLLETATNAEHYQQQQMTGVADNTVIAWSLSVKTGRQFIYHSIVKKDAVTVVGAVFDLINGTISSTDAGITARIRAQANGFYRITVIGSVGAGATQPAARTQSRVAGSVVYLGSTSTGFYAVDAQLESLTAATAVESSRIITTSASVTRSVDALQWALNLPPTGGFTVYAKVRNLGSAQMTTNPPYLWELGTHGVAPRMVQFFASASTIGHFSDNGATNTSGTASATAAYGDGVETSMSFTTAGVMQTSASVNGGATAQSAASTAVTPASAWSSAIISINRGDVYGGLLSYHKLRIAAGIQSLAYMQAG